MTAGRAPLERQRGAAEWIESPRFRCLGFDWSIVANESALVEQVSWLYAACADATPAPAAHVFTLRRNADASVSLCRNGQARIEQASTGLAMARLAWEVNRGVVETAGKRLLLHAAAAARAERVVVLAGPERSGKSTLVAALVCSGLRYLTDEAVAVDRRAAIAPYPKPVALTDDSLGALHELCPQLPAAPPAPGLEHLVGPQALRTDAVSNRGGVARLVVLLSEFRPGRTSDAHRVSRAEAAVTLADQAFNLQDVGPGGLQLIAELLRPSDCYRLDVGDLDVACGLVLDLLGGSSTR
jgi:hypothetical protein